MSRRNVRSRAAQCAALVGALEALESRAMLSGTSPFAVDDAYSLFSGGNLTTQSTTTVEQLDVLKVSSSSGEKPQSKVWTHDGNWFTVFAAKGGTYVWRLDGTTWTQILQLSNSSFQADVKDLGDVAHVLLQTSKSVSLASIQYDAASHSYELWSQRPTVVAIPSTKGTETAVSEIDSTGRMWVTYEVGLNVIVRYSDGDYSNWSGDIVLAKGLKKDDITSVIAMPDGQIGVFWSNQSAQRFGFRLHKDGDSADVWSADEVPAGQYALNVGKGMADDHMNLAVKADGTLYVAAKTSYDKSGSPRLILLVRRPNGVWDAPYAIDDTGSTRPTIEVREDTGEIIFAYRNRDSTGPIYYRELFDNGTTVSVGDEQLLMSPTAYNNVSSSKAPVKDDTVIIAAGGSKLGGVHIRFNNGVLVNDTDAQGDSLSAQLVSGPSHGSLTLNDDGSFSYTNNGDSATSDSFTYRAFDGTSSGNLATVTFTINPAPANLTFAATAPESVFSNSDAPLVSDSGDKHSVEVGMKFRSDVDGTVTGLKFYKSAKNTGTHIGHLWSSTGDLLATVTFSGETASGWQEATFSSPVSIQANTTYVISYFAPKGHYALDANYFTANVDSGSLHALGNGVDGGNGVATFGSKSAFPTTSNQSSNYWVDVLFA